MREELVRKARGKNWKYGEKLCSSDYSRKKAEVYSESHAGSIPTAIAYTFIDPEKLSSSPQRRRDRKGSQRKSKRYANSTYLPSPPTG
jgi:hypothetical protein